MNRTRKTIASLFASSLLALPLAGAASASAQPAESELVLAVYDAGGVETSRLSCAPAEGEHPRAAEACSQLAAAGGQFAEIPSDPDRICPFIYEPVTVAAFGTWNGEQVRYVEEFPNRCVMESETGTVFTF
ncbi:hypothetical protein GCM10023148_27580 [Actinokineospora soli]